jgi:hypothetical protein
MDATREVRQLCFDFPVDDFTVTGRGDNRRRPDPSESEIWGPLTAAIRAQWSEEERRLRMGFVESSSRRRRLAHC